MATKKRIKFLAGHDYGTGGTAMFIYADSVEQMKDMFPGQGDGFWDGDVDNHPTVLRSSSAGRPLKEFDIDDEVIQNWSKLSIGSYQHHPNPRWRNYQGSWPEGKVVDPDKWNPLDNRFSPYASMLEKFAESHQLRIKRYYHGQPCWSFYVKPSVEEHAKLDLHINDFGDMLLSTFWWVDDNSSGSVHRELKIRESTPITDDGQLALLMERQLNKILKSTI
ncbi:hypothetical protein QSV34_05050 [Porticoccus sp. W117]|uniref:hypothetical protein n=1 Tax=Porticoccus sp. W117 TaxID=3054777 RepID=UPI0025992694|nr:hypothetical protein [Porticoccus sp. W117]MDM3870715.1 hypothetical protein [Porticoccus sp. W117]